jgi:Protein of unknown function (DUF3108)
VNLSLNLPVFFRLSTLLLLLASTVFGQDGGAASSPPFSQAPYQVGEHLTYDVSFSTFSSVAYVDLKVVSRGIFAGRDSIQLRAHVQTTGVINVALFGINNDYTSYVDPGTGLPFHSRQVIRDATRSNDIDLDLNQAAGTDAIPSKQGSIPGIYDFLSAFYRLRAMSLRTGTVYNLTVRGENQDYQAEFRVGGTQVINTNVGSFTTIVVQVRVPGEPAFKNARIFFSDDDRHVPVLITAKLKNGELRAELAGSEFLKNGEGAIEITPPEVIATPTPTPTPTPKPSSSTKPSAPTKVDWPFTPGEQLNYQIFIGGSNAPLGIATFQVRGQSRYFDREGIFLSVSAQTTGAAARLFIANDKVESYVDPKSLLPYRTVLNLLEGKRRLNQTITVNQESGSASTNTGQKIDIPVGTHDYVSLFYVIRTLNLSPKKKSAVSILVENKPKTLFIDTIKRETIELGQEKLQAIALTLTTDDQPSDKYKFRIWISNDGRRLPLRITCQTELGPLRADLAIVPTPIQ